MCVRVFSSSHPSSLFVEAALSAQCTFRNFKNLIGEIHNVYTFRKIHAAGRLY